MESGWRGRDLVRRHRGSFPDERGEAGNRRLLEQAAHRQSDLQELMDAVDGLHRGEAVAANLEEVLL